jgi:predicted nuclease of predicted toxin-antitoxin system
MKFLLNMNLPRDLGRNLESVGHECRHAGDIGMARASDAVIVKEAKTHQEVIITHDLDYGHLLAFSGEKAPSVIILRLKNSRPINLFSRLTAVWSLIEKPLFDGAIIVLEDFTVRIRELPISPDRV